MPDFRALRSRRQRHEAVLYAFDLIEHDGNDLRDLPLIKRCRRLDATVSASPRWTSDRRQPPGADSRRITSPRHGASHLRCGAATEMDQPRCCRNVTASKLARMG
jgi:ATP-dependent DNA ligase